MRSRRGGYTGADPVPTTSPACAGTLPQEEGTPIVNTPLLGQEGNHFVRRS